MLFRFHNFMIILGLLLAIAGLSLVSESAQSVESNVYWRVDLNQGSSIIAYGQGATEEAAWEDCRRIRAITQAMTVADTRKGSVSAVTTQANRWCKNPMQIATVRPDPVVQPPVDCTVSDWGPPTDPAWLGCTGAQQTRAVIRIRSIVTQSANGGVACPALVETTTQTRTCAALSWTPPTRNTDGTTITGLTGYRIVYGRSPTELTQSIQIQSVSSYVLPELAPGTWYFAAHALAGGNQSVMSNVVTRVIP